MTRDAHLEKFRKNWLSGAVNLSVANGELLIGMVDDINNVKDIREIVSLMTP